MQNFAEQLRRAGISTLPVRRDTKAPTVPAFKQWMENLPTKEEIKNFKGDGIAIIGGAVSDGLVVLDFDNHYGNAHRAMKEWAAMPEVKEILDRYPFYLERTQRGGYHFAFRCPDEKTRSTKLAMEKTPEAGKYETLIEVKAEGGYCIVAPTAGYTALKGSLLKLPVLSPEERETLLSQAQLFDEKPPEPKKMKLKPVSGLPAGQSSGSVYEKFNREGAAEIESLLEQNGFNLYRTTDQNKYYTRPGKTKGVSISYNGVCVYSFSSNAHPFPFHTGLSNFDTFALLKHNGDEKAAVRELAEKYNQKLQRPGAQKADLSENTVNEQGNILPPNFFIETVYTERGGVKRTVDFAKFIDFLHASGYRKFREGDDFIFVQLQDNLVEIVEVDKMQNFTQKYILEHSNKDTVNFLISIDSLWSRTKLGYLQELPNKFNRDTRTEVWMYFLNKALKITADGFFEFKYSQLPLPVWRRHLLPYEWDRRILGYDGMGEWHRFCENVAGTPENLLRLRVALGYLASNYKQHSLSKAIIFIDGVIPQIATDANGGTGKSLLGKWISQYCNACVIDGRKIGRDANLQFLFQGVSPDTRIIFIDDADPQFNFQFLFSAITSDMTVRKLYVGEYVVPFEQSPKFLTTTNHSIRGTDESTNRRKFEVLISSHYGEHHTPRDDFGHDLIFDWSTEEWEASHCFLIGSIQLFLEHGLPEHQMDEHSALKIAISETSKEFVDFMLDALRTGEIRNNVEFDRKELYQKFTGEFEGTSDFKSLRLRSFTGWIIKFCRVFRLYYSDRRSNSQNLSKIWNLKNNVLLAEILGENDERNRLFPPDTA
ncbi:MAG: bifunctional DNA primase/polymerase [Bacteroidia bacterium]|nr:bifunctional DNA primase/polymerase [Bacteroidia bacterium]